MGENGSRERGDRAWKEKQMETAELAKQVGAFLTPFLPALLAGSQDGLKQAAEKLGKGTVEQAERLWRRLWPGLEQRPAAVEAAQEAAKAPNDGDAQAALRLQLRKLLTEQPALASEVEQLFEQARRSGAVTAAQRGVAIGGDASGNIIVTGDQNTIG